MTAIAGATDVGTLANVLANMRNAQQTVAALTAEAGSGYLATTYDGLGSAAAPALDLTGALDLNKTLQANATSAGNAQTVAQTALGQIQTLVSGISSQLLGTGMSSAAGFATISTSAQSALQQIAGLLDTQSGGVYVFAGQDSNNPPVPNPQNITGSAFYAAIGTALANLPTAGASATQTQLLGAAAAGVTSPFSATLEASNATATVDLGGGQRVQVGVLADQNTDAVSSGASTTSTGSYMRDILMGLATLSNMNGSDPQQANNAAMLSTVSATLNGASTALNTDIGGLGVRQDAITNAQTDLSATATTVTNQLGALQDADPATVATQLAQAQTQLQASYSVVASLQQLTLAKYMT